MGILVPSKEAVKKGDEIFRSLAGLSIQDAKLAIEHASGKLSNFIFELHEKTIVDHQDVETV